MSTCPIAGHIVNVYKFSGPQFMYCKFIHFEAIFQNCNMRFFTECFNLHHQLKCGCVNIK